MSTYNACESYGGHRGQICCISERDVRCKRPAGNAHFSKRLEKTIRQRNLQLKVDSNAHHVYMCNTHKRAVQGMSRRHKTQQREHSTSKDTSDEDEPQIDFLQLPVRILHRYRSHYKLPWRQGMNKAQLADVVGAHFRQMQVNEKEVLTYFIYMSKNSKNRLDKEQPSTEVAQSPR